MYGYETRQFVGFRESNQTIHYPTHEYEIQALVQHHGVTVDKKNNVAIVKAGTVIGPNPEIDDENIGKSLVRILNQHGYAKPDLGGITWQTIAGFLSAGAAGGSMSYSFYDVFVGIRLIDGKDTMHDISKKDSKFYEVGISMGLFGIYSCQYQLDDQVISYQGLKDNFAGNSTIIKCFYRMSY